MRSGWPVKFSGGLGDYSMTDSTVLNNGMNKVPRNIKSEVPECIQNSITLGTEPNSDRRSIKIGLEKVYNRILVI